MVTLSWEATLLILCYKISRVASPECVTIYQGLLPFAIFVNFYGKEFTKSQGQLFVLNLLNLLCMDTLPWFFSLQRKDNFYDFLFASLDGETFFKKDFHVLNYATGMSVASVSPVLRIDNQQNFKIMKILILLKSFISLFYIIRYIFRSML